LLAHFEPRGAVGLGLLLLVYCAAMFLPRIGR